MDKRNDTRQEVLLDVRNEPITSIDEPVAQCRRAPGASPTRNYEADAR